MISRKHATILLEDCAMQPVREGDDFADVELNRAFAASFTLETYDRAEHLHQMMLDRRARLFSVIGSWLVLIGIVAFVTCCASTRGTLRNATEQDRTAVVVATPCGTGSGVLVDDTHVLTAGHMTRCQFNIAVVVDKAGVVYQTRLVHLDTRNDLALFEIPKFTHAKPPVVAEPKLLSRVCAANGFPHREQTCGTIWKITKEEEANVYHTIPTAHGNSGSGVYDALGRLIGIVTNLELCDIKPDGQCGGRFTSLHGRGGWL